VETAWEEIMASTKVGFNGATALRPWRLGAAAHHSWSHERFNGATALRPWRRSRNKAPARVGSMLQWGHGSEAVETISCLVSE